MGVLSVEHGGDEIADLLGVVVLCVLKRFAHACQALAVSGGAFGADCSLSLLLNKQVRVGIVF